MKHFTHCDFHLGDNLVHLHFLRALAALNPQDSFFHAAHQCHLEQLVDAVEDLKNIQLLPYEDRIDGSLNVWKNSGAGTSMGGFWEKHPERMNFSAFHLSWFENLANLMGFTSPFTKPSDLLFNYPAIQEAGEFFNEEFDFLIVNSRPCSGQFMPYDSVDCMDGLISDLAKRHKVTVTQKSKVPVPCTTDSGMSITDIGGLSLHCKNILMVATGPCWPTFNVWNQESVGLRLVLLDSEKLDHSANTVHARSLEMCRQILTEKGFL